MKRYDAAFALVSVLFSGLAMLETAVCASLVLLAAVNARAPLSNFPRAWMWGTWMLVCAVLVQAVLFLAMRAWRASRPTDPAPRKGYRGYQGGTPPHWSRRDRRRTLRAMLAP